MTPRAHAVRAEYLKAALARDHLAREAAHLEANALLERPDTLVGNVILWPMAIAGLGCAAIFAGTMGAVLLGTAKGVGERVARER